MKEAVMIFLVVFFIERADLMLRSKNNSPPLYITVILLLVSLFYFRTALGIVAVLATISSLIFSTTRIVGLGKRLIIISWLLISGYFLFSGAIFGEVSKLIEDRDSNQSTNMIYRVNREGGNKFATYGSTIIFAPQILIAPYPTLVDIDYQKNQMMLNGMYYSKNVIAFFVLIALLSLFNKKSLLNHVLILSFTFGYLFLIAMSAFALSERFHLPALPFLLIFAGYGVTRLNTLNTKFYIPYLIIISIIIIGWNWFKLAGRGLY